MRSRPTIVIVLVSMLALLVAGTATAVTERPTKSRAGRPQPVTERLTAGELALEVRAKFERAALTVTGPRNTHIRKTFAAGETISVRLVDETGTALPDGRYNYTLAISPRPKKGSSFMRGLFFIDDGVAVSRETLRAERGRTRDELNLRRSEKSMQSRNERKQRQGERARKAPPREAREGRGQRSGAARPGGGPSANYNFDYGIGIYDYYPNQPYLRLYQSYYYGGPYYYFGGLYAGFYYYNGYYYANFYSYGSTFNNMYAGFSNFIYADINVFYGYDYTFNYAFYGNQMGAREHVFVYSFLDNWSIAGWNGPPFGYYAGYLFNIAYAYSYYNPGLYIYGGIAGLASRDFYLGVFNGVYVTPTGVGVNNYAPSFPLDVLGTIQMEKTDSSTAAMSFKISGPTTNQQWIFFNNGVNGNFEIFNGTNPATPFTIEAGAPAQLMRLTAAGTVRVKGVTVHPDYLFEPDYQLESIEEHANNMWDQKHLPAVGSGKYDQEGNPYIDLAGTSAGMLEELEKAHIYIAQLNESLTKQTELNEELATRLERLESLDAKQGRITDLEERLIRLETELQRSENVDG